MSQNKIVICSCFISFNSFGNFSNEKLVFSFFFFFNILIGLPHGSFDFCHQKKLCRQSTFYLFLYFIIFLILLFFGLTFLLKFSFYLLLSIYILGDWTKQKIFQRVHGTISLPFLYFFFYGEVNEIFQNLSTLDQIIHRDFLLGMFIFCFFYLFLSNKSNYNF